MSRLRDYMNFLSNQEFANHCARVATYPFDKALSLVNYDNSWVSCDVINFSGGH